MISENDSPFSHLLPYEQQRVIEAIRRDMRNEERLVASDPNWADFHKKNVRNDISLLEALNPKHPDPKWDETVRRLREVSKPKTEVKEQPLELAKEPENESQ